MRTVPKLGVAVLVLMLLACGQVALAQPLADRVPQDAVAYLGWCGSQNMGAGYADSHLKAVLDASGIPQLIDESIPRLLQKIGRDDREVSTFTSLLSAIGGPMWRRPFAIYFGGVDLANPQAPMPKLALICDAGPEAKALSDQVNKLVLQAGRLPIPVRCEEQGGVVVLAVGSADVTAANKPAAPLSANAQFKKAMGQANKEALVALYIDFEGALAQIDKFVAQFAPPDVAPVYARAKDVTGFSGLKRLIATSGFDGRDWSSNAWVEAPEPRKGLVRVLLDRKPLSQEILRAIPKSATIAQAGQFSFADLLMELRKIVNAVEPNAGAQFEQTLDMFKQGLGLDLQQDILDPMGDEWAFFVDPAVGGNGLLGFTLVNRLKNPAKAEKTLARLEEMANAALSQVTAREKMTIAFNTTRQGDLTIHYLAVPVVAPSWAVKDGNLYMALYPQVVLGAAEHVASKGKSILENEDFLASRKRLGVNDASAVAFIDLVRNAPEGYHDVLLLTRLYLGLADLFGAKTPPMLLPPLSRIMPHLSPAGGASWVDKEGWHSRSVSPFPGSEVLGTGGAASFIVAQQAAIMSVILPSLNRARSTANQVKSANNLRQIGQAMLLYANEHKGRYPATMGELLEQDLSPIVFVNPNSATAVPPGASKEELAKWVNNSSDYVYLGKGKNSSATGILVHEKFGPGAQRVNVLFGDGHVEALPPERVSELLGNQK